MRDVCMFSVCVCVSMPLCEFTGASVCVSVFGVCANVRASVCVPACKVSTPSNT